MSTVLRPPGWAVVFLALSTVSLAGCAGEPFRVDARAEPRLLRAAPAEEPSVTALVRPPQRPAGAEPAAPGPEPTPKPKPSPPRQLACPPPVRDRVLECVRQREADPDRSAGEHLLDSLLDCVDAEPLTAFREVYCESERDDPACELDAETAETALQPLCLAAAREPLFSGRCALPAEYAALGLNAPVVRLASSRLTASDGLNDVQRAQLLALSAAVGFPAHSVEDALEQTDDGAFEQLDLLDYGSGRRLRALSAYYGDTRVGRVFFAAGTVVAATIDDGFVNGCAVERKPLGAPCAANADCAAELTCSGAHQAAPGVCVPAAAEAAQCASDADCSERALCLPSLEGRPGCRGAWFRGRFASEQNALVNGAVESALVAAGVGARVTGSRVSLQLELATASQLRVELVSPAGTSAIAWDGAVNTDSLRLTEVAVHFAEAPPALGEWRLRISGASEKLSVARLAWSLELATDSAPR